MRSTYARNLSSTFLHKPCQKHACFKMATSFGDTVSGGLGGLACVLAGQPFDTVKVKLQTFPDHYKSVWDAVSKTHRKDGLFKGFYAGCTPAVVSNVAENAVLFVFYEHCQRLVQWVTGVQNPNDLTIFQRACAGSCASAFSSIAIAPPDRIKCMMQVQQQMSEKRKTTEQSAWRVVKEVVRKEGPLGMFRGLTSIWIREIPGYFFFFGGYSASRKLLTPANAAPEELSVWRLALAGGIAGCCYWISVFPIDVTKANIQVKGDLSGSFWVTFMQMFREGGIRGFYKGRGLLPAVIRCFPADAALFVTYEYSRKIMALYY